MINQISNFLDQHILEEIRQKFENSKGQGVFEINNMGRWGAGLETGSYAPVFVLNLDEYHDYFINKYKTVDPAFEDFDNVICFLHVWPPGSQINFHHDFPEGNDRLSSTIYINEAWNWNWGGLFIYDDTQLGQGWVFPHPNHMVWFRPPVWHSTSMITLAAEYPRLSIQLFFTK
jgi:Rps23 Pro-64 3,4-dihydroxylase Tpa1-like proline 4-hydroxylase